MPDTVDHCHLCREQDVARRIARLRRIPRNTEEEGQNSRISSVEDLQSSSNITIRNIASMTDQELMAYLAITDERRRINMKEQEQRIESQRNQKGGRKKRKTNKRKKKRSQTKKNKRRVKKKLKSRKNRR